MGVSKGVGRLHDSGPTPSMSKYKMLKGKKGISRFGAGTGGRRGASREGQSPQEGRPASRAFSPV